MVNQGYHSFNQVAIVDTLKKKEDSVDLQVKDPLAVGKHTISVDLQATNGNKLTQTFNFEVVTDKAKREAEIKQEQLTKTDAQKQEEQTAAQTLEAATRAADMSVFSKLISDNTANITINQFLVFTTESKSAILLTETTPDFKFFMRAPSNQQLLREDTKVTLDGIDVTPLATVSPQGDKLNLDFFGMNLAKVAADFNLTDFGTTTPYIVIALLSAIAQYFVTTLYTGLNPQSGPTVPAKKNDKNDKNKGKKTNEEEPDFAQIMTDSTRQMNYIFPLMTMMMGLGYLGGAALIPSGVTLFWTGQNGFVIIQQLITERKKVIANVKEKISRIQARFNK
jgi:hypothetical protein